MNLEELKRKKVSAVSLGCDKNRVDLEKMLYNLKQFGFNITYDIDDAEILIINTCAFIQPAIDEVAEYITIAGELKQNKLEKAIVTGCLISRFNKDIIYALANIDAVLDIKENDKIVQTICSLYDIEVNYEFKNGRMLTNPPHFAYLKIADGCNNCCSYCMIPRIRGRYKSVPMEEIIKEAKTLVSDGATELIIIAQDITRYGYDLYEEYKLIPLLRELSKIKNLHWIRLHYLYPEMVTDELLMEIKNNPKICKYIDVPFQHIDDDILKAMNRKSGEQDIRNLVKNIHDNYPEIAIRTTFIVGFPGETKKQFNKLITFLEEARLNNVGFFPYFREEPSRAAYMKGQKWNITKKRRLKKAQKTQEKIMHALNIDRLESEVEIVVDGYDAEGECFIARTSKDSPEVDFIVVLDANEKVEIGKYYKAKLKNYILGLFEGEIVYELTK